MEQDNCFIVYIKKKLQTTLLEVLLKISKKTVLMHRFARLYRRIVGKRRAYCSKAYFVWPLGFMGFVFNSRPYKILIKHNEWFITQVHISDMHVTAT